MSKLAHSNDELMYEIEMKNNGMEKLDVITHPLCEYETIPHWCKPRGATCKRKARYWHNKEKLYCKQHAEIVIANGA